MTLLVAMLVLGSAVGARARTVGPVLAPAFEAKSFALAESLAHLRVANLEHGRPGLALALTLDSLVMARYEQGYRLDSLTLAASDRAIAIKSRLFGAGSAEASTSIELAGQLRSAGDDLAAADSLFSLVLASRRAHLKPGHRVIGVTWMTIADVRREQGRYASADSALANASSILRGPNGQPADRLQLALSEASLRGSEGRYAEAFQALVAEQPEAERVFGERDLDVIELLNLKATQEERLGRLTDARDHFARALALSRSVLGDDNPRTVTAINNLAILLGQLHQLGEERTMLLEALERHQRRYGPDDLHVGRVLNSLGAAYIDMDSLPQAGRVLERSLAIKLAKLGEGHPSTIATQSNLASLLTRMRDFRGASEMQRQVLAGRERALGPNHPEVAVTRSNLGTALAEQHRFAEAREVFEPAVATLTSRLGEGHPFTQRARFGLAVTLAALGEPTALAEALAAEWSWREQARHMIRALPEEEATRAAANRHPGLAVALTLVDTPGRLPADSLARVLDAVVRSRGVEFDELLSRHRARIASGEDAAAEAAAFEAARGRVARALAAGIVAGAADTLVRLERAEGEAERALLARSARFRAADALERAGLDEVLRALPARSALVSYVRVRPPTVLGRDSLAAARGSLLAFVARPGAPPIVERLGSLTRLDSLVERWRALVGQPPAANRDAERDLNAAGEALRRFAWDRVQAHLAGLEQVFVVPDGTLQLANLEALPAVGGGYLVERGPLLHLLTRERDLLAPERSSGEDRRLALGAPDFERAEASPGTEPMAAVFRGERPACWDFASIRWRPLPATANELDDVVASWRRSQGGAAPLVTVERLDGAAASEAAFKAAAPGARWIHMATHGFLIDERCQVAASGTRGVGGVVHEGRHDHEGAEAPGGANVASDRDTTMTESATRRLSGLVLAGANAPPAPGGEDGILTAEEVATLDLSAANGIVLSACESGLGELREAEGVLGLRHALRVAGARTQVMSLWPVGDRATRRWMQGFYAALASGEGTSAAARSACRAELARRRAAGESTNPFHWAGFIALGP